MINLKSNANSIDMQNILKALGFLISEKKAEIFTKLGSVKVTWDDDSAYSIYCHNGSLTFYDQILPEQFSEEVVVNKILFLLDAIAYVTNYSYESAKKASNCFGQVVESFALIRRLTKQNLENLCQKIGVTLGFILPQEFIFVLQQINLYSPPKVEKESALEEIPQGKAFKQAREFGKVLFEELAHDYQVTSISYLGCGHSFQVSNQIESFELWLVPQGNTLTWEFRKLPSRLKEDFFFYDPMEYTRLALECPF